MDETWIDLLNSDWHDHLGSGRRADRLGDDKWLDAFLARWPWAAKLKRERLRNRLRDLRTQLREMVECLVAGGRISPDQWQALNEILARGPIRFRLEAAGEERRILSEPLQLGINSLLAQIALPFARVLAEGEPARIKLCDNADCRWVFYDRSKNRSRRWCEAATCGNLMKVRRFRARKRS